MLHLSSDLPMIIGVVDTRGRIMEVMPEVKVIAEQGLASVHDVGMTRKMPEKK